MHVPILCHLVYYNLQRREYILIIQQNKHVYNINCMCGVYKCEKVPSHLEWWLFV
jgi:hypothetical protein